MMVPNMRGSSCSTRYKATEKFIITMVTSMKVSGLTTRIKGMASTRYTVADTMKECSIMICTMDKVRRHGPTGLPTREISLRARSKAKALMYNMTVLSTEVNGLRIILKVLVITNGQTEEVTLDSGLVTRCTAKASKPGQTEGHITGSSTKIKGKALVYISGQMAPSIKESGKMENKTDKAFYLSLRT
jgi:hypothetical protein